MTESDALLQQLAFVAGGVNRAAQWRGDDARIEGLLRGGAARILPVWNQRHLIWEIDGQPRAAHLDAATLNADQRPVFLGVTGETPWFALGLEGSDTAPDLGGAFRALHDVVTLLPTEEASLLVYARGMVIWHGNHRFCGRCGAATRPTEAGHSLTCTACAHRSFPRMDPAVITLVSHPDGEHCLLGRQPAWPPGMYSTVAGFVEPGETLEAAVARETAEETGIQVTDIRYIRSQPWPFPTSLMLGFRARAMTTTISRDDEELEDCRWFTRDQVRSFGEMRSTDEGFKLPNPFSISRYLIETWLREG